LRQRGIAVMIGQRAENVAGVAVVVTSTAVKRDNPEVVAASKAAFRWCRRAEMLAELMRLKNTVAVAGHARQDHHDLDGRLSARCGGIDPTVINGGIINSDGSNARLGDSEWMVVASRRERTARSCGSMARLRWSLRYRSRTP